MAETIVLKDGNVFLVALRDGRMSPGVDHALGLWFRDCRFLCVHELRLCGELPLLLTATDAAGTEAVHELTNPDLELGDGERLPAESLRLRLESTVRAEGALRQRIAVSSYHRQPIRLSLELRLGADFLPMLELRGVVPRHERPPPEAGPDGFSLVGRDGVRRATRVRATPEPRVLDDGSLVFDLDLEARGAIDLVVDFEVSESGNGEVSTGAPRKRHDGGTRVTSDDQLFNRILERSLHDLDLLESELDGHSYYAAGVPWFATLFGRDSLITSFQTLSFDRGIAAETLRLLAGRLGQEHNDERDEEPGKVLHELRVGEPATLGETPFARYYGSVDATPLFLCLLGRHADWSGSLDLFRELRAPAEAALEWIDRYADLDGDGLVEYQRRSEHGLVTQGWKDSADGVPDADGEPLTGPVALVEVQGYVIRAKRLMARMFELDGEGARAERLRDEATALELQLERFWLPDPGCYAIALDGDKRPGSGLTSNQGHLLWSGAVSAERARAIRDVLMSDQMFTRLGRPDAGLEPSGLQPAGLPHRLRVAARQRADRVRPAPLRLRRGLHARSSRGCSKRPRAFTTTACRSCSRASRARSPTSPCPTRWRAGHRPGRPARSRSCSSAGSGSARTRSPSGSRSCARRCRAGWTESRCTGLALGDASDRPRVRARGRAGDAGRRAGPGRCRGGAHGPVSGRTAGPSITSPCAAKRDPWQGQSQLRSAEFQLTMQPRWVQRAESSCSAPSSSR